MTRPNIDPAALVTFSEGWDAILRDIVSALAKTPLPVPEYANAAALPSASSYDRCLATTADNNKLWFSKSASWVEVTIP